MSASRFFAGKSVLITGASSGIGRCLALQLGGAGARLTLAARRADLLAALADAVVAAGGPRPVVSVCDVTREGDPEQAVMAAVNAFGGLDVVFANAGFGVVGFLEQLAVADYRRQLETNVFGVLRTLKASQAEIIRSRGNVVIIGSVAGHCATPGNSPYSMSKFAIRALAYSITGELARHGVAVTLVSPGFIASDIRKVDNQGKLHPGAAESMPAWLVMDTDKAARQILRAVAAKRAEVIITAHGKLLVAIQRFAPWIIRMVGRRMAARGRGHRSEVS
ncbi:MAG TPA: SDR family NAD(P)-dependent oxidoreductase [Steroidobacteraceae bacterium]|nr:SDR family NAD(P)-dependent oxidoreductase [Steroidobacteraceae bacterium]